MLSVALQTAAIIVAGLMVGNELCISAFVHPRLRALDDRLHIAAVQALARALGAVMPFWYAATLPLTGIVAYRLHAARAASAPLAGISAALWLFSILYTVAGPVRINVQVSGWDLERLPEDWKQQRGRWDTLHAIRVVILVVALACLVAACLEARTAA